MTLAEYMLLAAVCVLVYRLLRPLQRRLELWLLRVLGVRVVIDVTLREILDKKHKEKPHE